MIYVLSFIFCLSAAFAHEPTSGLLKIDSQEIYWEESGNPDGQAVIILSNGLDSCNNRYKKNLFNNKFKVLTLHKRGCGKSTPHGSLKDNTVHHIVNDMEALREACKIDKWVVFGDSLNSTIALTYAIKHPNRVKFLMLQGILLGRDADVQWIFSKKGFGRYSEFFINIKETDNVIEDFSKRLKKGFDLDLQKDLGNITNELIGVSQEDLKNIDPKELFNVTKIAFHMLYNKFFFKNNWILEHADKIRSIPGLIMHGQCDHRCYTEMPWSLHKAWPRSYFKIIDISGHMIDDAISEYIIKTTKKI